MVVSNYNIKCIATMLFYMFGFSYLVCFVNSSSSSSHQTSKRTVSKNDKNIPAVDALIARLEQEQWSSDDEPCLQTTLDILWGVKNNTLWATWVWDSMQPPVGSFYGSRFHGGSYDQCLQAPWSTVDQAWNPSFRTQYCLVDIKYETVEKFVGANENFTTSNLDTSTFNEHSFGICLPASCSVLSVARIARHMHQLTHLPDGYVFVDHRDCKTAGEVVEYSWKFCAFWALIGLLLATAVYATFYHEDKTLSSMGVIIKSFCVKRNYRSLFKVNSDEIQVMNGMRVITAALMVQVHEGFFTCLNPTVNESEVNKFLQSLIGLSLSHTDIYVDTFFAMSGLLIVRGLMIGKQRNVLYTLVKRYLRLIGPILMCLLYLTAVFEYVDEGPFWSRAKRLEKEVCQKYWWKTMLMVNTDVETICPAVTWYVSCDFQLAILATFLFYMYRQNQTLGVSAFLVAFTGLTFNVAWTVYRNEFDILPFTLHTLRLNRNHTALNFIYLKSYSRTGSYFIGMVMGYFLSTYKPIDHRNIVSMKWSIIATIVSLVTMLTMLSVGTIFSGRPYNPLVAAVVVATNRVFWALGVCCVIGACEYGTLPLVKDCLSWRGFVPLSKLSYGLYLLHPFIVQKEKYAARNAAMFSAFNLVVQSSGVAVLAYALSLGLYLILEAPLINISNALFSDKSAASQPNEVKKTFIQEGITNENGHAKAKVS